MTDYIDDAQAESDFHLNVALSKREPSMPFIGRCHWCNDPVGADAHFCDQDCSHDWHQYKRKQGQ